ncbi:MAG: hypothetical protein EAY75_00940, partial [Bacteroidetes bacterium]
HGYLACPLCSTLAPTQTYSPRSTILKRQHSHHFLQGCSGNLVARCLSKCLISTFTWAKIATNGIAPFPAFGVLRFIYRLKAQL